MLFQNGILAAFPILVTEYGLLTRRTTLERLSGKWRPGRSLLRLAFWLAFWLHAGADGPAALRAAVGLAVGELAAALLRRQVGRDVEAGLLHGRPVTHLIPLAAGALFVLLLLLSRRIGPGVFHIPQAGGRPLVVAASLISLWSWATMLTVSVVDLARPEQIGEEDAPRVGPGELIGLLERLITFTLVFSGALPAVGFVVAAKAAARYPQFKQKAFAEYFLIGTLTSAGLAVLFGLLAAGGAGR